MIRIILLLIMIAMISFLVASRNKKRKKGWAIAILVISTLLFALCMVPTIMKMNYKERPTTGEYQHEEASAILIDPSRIESFETDGSFREVPVHFYFPEHIDQMEEKSLPLVIFSHGAFGYYQSNSSTYMELASHGYVVVSLDHPYHSFFTKDSKGKTVIVNSDFFKTALDIGGSDVPEAEIYDTTSRWMDLRIADMNFVVDELQAAAVLGEPTGNWHVDDKFNDLICDVLKATDYEKIGLMGHSLGGATAVTVGRRADISAVIDLDGTMLGEEKGVQDGVVLINEDPYPNPILAIENEEHHDQEMAAIENSYAYANNVVMKNALCGYETYFKDAGHMNFTDLPLIAPPLADMLGTGPVDAGECIDTMNGIILNFFDCYLKGIGTFSVQESY
ncbi:hypothetical protein D6855_01140 [Butyrivibrio sp. CB08]|uniref:alpha/beta hydrolase family protein n=1 Tax=Butyrivibrio sp. CB08 TaxID=2364879 RepID=UPI000EA84916|nr:hypothetical protein [Butyrivibrio sp. CB08]RKM62054.1 hypothetical protein D6855_01140 [Butyrivibrio sp. CB08]